MEAHPPIKLFDLTISKYTGNLRARKLYKLPEKCEICGRKAEHRHHKDEEPRNNRPENIAFLCNSCHKEHHLAITAAKSLTITTLPPDSKPVNQKPKQIRKQMRFTMQETARLMCISAPHLCDLEKGRRNWTDDMKKAWSKALSQPFPENEP